jgi:hypothetical protein
VKKTTEYTVELDVNARYRVRHVIERGQVLSFVVQLEVEKARQWHPVRRSDSAHGQAHWHVFHRQRKTERIALTMGFNEGLTQAKQAVKNHWQEFIEQWKNE